MYVRCAVVVAVLGGALAPARADEPTPAPEPPSAPEPLRIEEPARARGVPLAIAGISAGVGLAGGALAFFSRWDDAVSPVYAPTMVAGATVIGHRFVRQRPASSGPWRP
jgi:hypothetical protein